MSDPLPDPLQHIHGIPVMVLPAEGEPLRDTADFLDLLGSAAWGGARWVVLPAGRLTADFFRLRTGVAGDILQKFVNYRLGLAIVGDISAHTAASSALRDLIQESNKGTQTWFLPTLDDLGRLLGARYGAVTPDSLAHGIPTG